MGINFNVLKIFINVWSPKQLARPPIAIIISSSSIFNKLSNERITNIKIRITIKQQTINPNSSPATAKIKSVFASGILSFSVPWPGPFPNHPPDLKAFKLWSIWSVPELGWKKSSKRFV